MAERTLIEIALFFIYYNIGGLATTNILRLTRGNTLPILSSVCQCDHCGAKIPPLLQLPIISYIICKGQCRNCHSKIPGYPLLLEVAILLGMSLCSALLKFSFWGILMSFLFYEIMRILMVLLKGKREDRFCGQYVIAVLSMVPFALLCLFVSALYAVV